MVLHLLMVRRGVNIFKIVILAGTFALAFAFAGNDLVNFVGVPLAAWESWQQFTASGMAADAFTMEGLRKAVQTPTFYLLLSGLIMVLTLWFSKKAHRVVQTSINLSSSTRGDQEQFGSSLPGRLIVRAGLSANKTLHQILPNSLFTALESRMQPVEQVKGAPVLPFAGASRPQEEKQSCMRRRFLTETARKTGSNLLMMAHRGCMPSEVPLPYIVHLLDLIPDDASSIPSG